MIRIAVRAMIGAALATALACGAGKAPAEQAVAAADSAVAAVAGEAAKYVPDQLKGIQDVLTSAKASLEQGQYQVALTTAQEIPGKVAALQTAVSAKKEELTKAWASMAGTTQALDAIKARLATLSTARRLPDGLTATAVADAKSSLATVTQAWADAGAAAQSGDLAAAVTKASSIQDQLAALVSALQMPAATQAN